MVKVCLDSLIDKALLRSAWSIVKSKGACGGIDDVSIEDYSGNVEENLADLSVRLADKLWCPQPYQMYSLIKPKGGARLIGRMTVEDKIVQHALKMMIEPLLERTFSSSSYAYRSGKGHAKAIRRTWAECTKKINNVYLRLDIDNFFDTIDRQLLFTRLKYFIKDADICRYIELSLSMGRVNESMEWEEMDRGIPQGAVLSPLLANFYLNSLDQSVLSKTTSYVRYSDDLVLFASSESEANEFYSHIKSYLNERLKLKLNDTVSIGQISDGFTFLGLTISKNEISISDVKLIDLSRRISKIEIKGTHISDRYIETLSGIKSYYSKILPSQYARKFDDWLRETIKGWIVANPGYSSRELLTIFSSIQPFCPENDIRSWLKEFSSSDVEVDDSGQDLNRKLIRSRKLEYQRREADNSELVITAPGYFIGLSNRGVTLRKNGQPLKAPPSTALRHITIMSDGVTLSTNVISFCMSNGIPIDIFDCRCTHIASILSPKFMLTTLWNNQKSLSSELCGAIARKIIIGKIKNQLSLCKYFNKYHKHTGQLQAFNTLNHSIGILLDSIKSLKDIECTGKKLMPFEARAADLYWSYISGLIADDGVEFYSRVKKGAKDVVNSMLNYGYSLLYPRIWQSLLRKRLNPYIGFIHYADGNPNLVFDVIELFRSQAVDRVVISMIQKGESVSVDSNGVLSKDARSNLTKRILERLHRYEKYRGVQMKFIDVIDRQVSELAESISSGVVYRPYLAKW